MDSLHVKDGTDELHKEDLESSPPDFVTQKTRIL